MTENDSHYESPQAPETAHLDVGAPRADDQPVILTDMRLRKIPLVTPRHLHHELNKAKEHLRQSSQTFANVGRLRAFLVERIGEKRGPMPPHVVPLQAMKYILWLEKRLSRLDQQVPSAANPMDMK